MRDNLQRRTRLTAANDRDPREEGGAEIIDLATRSAVPGVTQRKPGREGLGLAAGVAVVALLGGVTLWTMNASRQAKTAPSPQVAAGAPSVPAPMALDVPPAVPPQAITTVGAMPAPAPAPVLAAPPSANPAAAPAANPFAAPTVIFDSSALPLPAPALPAGNAGATPNTPAAPAGNANDEFASKIGGVGGTTAVATNSLNPRTTVTQGTLIPAVLETAIDTDVPGYVRAVVSADVRSFDGTRILIPRSSRLIGQYKSGMQAGQKRAYVIWTRLIRPDGVSVNLASPAVGFGGETGLAGKVDGRFFERFGSAMLMSVIGAVPALINSTAALVVGTQTQSAAAAAIGQSGQIGPTVRVPQGEPIRVFTARDLDFSRVTTG